MSQPPILHDRFASHNRSSRCYEKLASTLTLFYSSQEETRRHRPLTASIRKIQNDLLFILLQRLGLLAQSGHRVHKNEEKSELPLLPTTYSQLSFVGELVLDADLAAIADAQM